MARYSQRQVHIVFSPDQTECVVTCEIWYDGERTHALVSEPLEVAGDLMALSARQLCDDAFPSLFP